MSGARGTAKVHALLPNDSSQDESWSEFLERHLDPKWRRGEWNADSGVFTPNPSNPATAVVVCGRKGCGRVALKAGRESLCRACEAERHDGGLKKAEILGKPLPPRAKRADTTKPCKVVVGGVRCEHEGTSGGLCRNHSAAYRLMGEGYSLDKFAREGVTKTGKPLAMYERSDCSVEGCTRAAWPKPDLEFTFCIPCGQRLAFALKQGRVTGAADWLERFAEPSSGSDLSVNLWTLKRGSTRVEMLYVLEQFDKKRAAALDVAIVNRFVRGIRERGLDTLVGQDEILLEIGSSGRGASFANLAIDVLAQARRSFDGYDPASADALYLQDLNLRVVKSSPSPVREVAPLDLTEISQVWLREAFRSWVLTSRAVRNHVVTGFSVMKAASKALSDARPDHGHRPERLGLADMTTVVNGLHEAWTQDGQVGPNYDTLKHVLRLWWSVVDVGRRDGLWNEIPSTFAKDASVHKNLGIHTAVDDEDGKALPSDVVKHLRASVDLLTGPNAEMYRALCCVLMDTGRRPVEVVSLKRDCLRKDGTSDEWWLLWDNHKSGRNARRLPINSETVEAIQRWQAIIDVTNPDGMWLFPSSASIQGKRHINASTLGNIVTTLCGVAPPMTSAVMDANGQHVAPTLVGITPYDFRHSYAQRHADAGVPPDTLRELMDHKNFETTMGYYRVGAKRKREAAKMVAPLARDALGRQVGISEARHGLSTVAVPFGGCAEPSNVKAGGSDCPVRFQCSGCNFYRPDPSYLPDLERHVADLKMNLAAARKMESPGYVTSNFEGQIADYKKVIARMRDDLDAMSEDQRMEIEAAAVVLRRSRAAEGQGRLLPLTVVRAAHDGAGEVEAG